MKAPRLPTPPAPAEQVSTRAAASPRAELVAVHELHPWEENPRRISPGRLANLQRALAADPEFLRLRPILARKRDGLIYCGNQRYLAAVADGAAAVPAILEDVDERTMRERAIRDNEQWGEWSDGLGLVFRSLQSEAGEPADVDLVPPEIATTQPGEVYLLGPRTACLRRFARPRDVGAPARRGARRLPVDRPALRRGPARRRAQRRLSPSGCASAAAARRPSAATSKASWGGVPPRRPGTRGPARLCTSRYQHVLNRD